MKRTSSDIATIAIGMLPVCWLVSLWLKLIPFENWALYCYTGIIIAAYFSILWSTSLHSSPSKTESETIAVILFLATSLLLVIAFGAGWIAFDNFSSKDHAPTITDAYYFSAVTFTTLGFGEFVPINDAGKIYASIEALMGTTHMVAFFSIITSRIVRNASKG